MSLGRKERITCPKCQNTGSFTIWEIIDTAKAPKMTEGDARETEADRMAGASLFNADQSPDAVGEESVPQGEEMKEQVVSGEIFRFTCPFCKYKVSVNYGFLYHQVEDALMIQYATSEELVQEGIESFRFMAGGNIPGFELSDDYRFRVVRTQHQVREKILINEAGLDDKVIELMKIFMLSEMQQASPGLEVSEFLFDLDDEKKPSFDLICTDGRKGSVDFIQEVYDSIANQFAVEIREDDAFLIDVTWAMELLNANAQEDGLSS